MEAMPFSKMFIVGGTCLRCLPVKGKVATNVPKEEHFLFLQEHFEHSSSAVADEAWAVCLRRPI